MAFPSPQGRQIMTNFAERLAALSPPAWRPRDWPRAATLALRGYGPPIFVYLRSVLRDDALAGD